MGKSCLSFVFTGVIALAGPVFAQDAPAAAPPAAAAAPAKSAFTQGGMDFSFLFDGYVDKNFNNPDSGYNQLRNFDLRANTLHVNLGKITIDKAPGPVGFHLDVGFGQTLNWIGATDTRSPDAFKYFEQAYISFKPKAWKGVQIDVGKFVTGAGAEVIETNANWNYSRSLLFALAIPYFHSGIRTTIPVGHFTGGFQVLQGWNNVYDNNSGKTFCFMGSYAWKKATWSNMYMVGPEKAHTNKGLRHLYDTVLTVNQTDKLSYNLNFDYGQDNNITKGSQKWGGVAAGARYQIAPKFALASRVEFFKDADGFATGAVQNVKEVTFTAEQKLSSWLMARAEFRNDWSDVGYFDQGRGKIGKNQPTALLGVIAFLGPKK